VTFTAILDLSGRHVVVVGGSSSALGKISSLLEAQARVTVISSEVAATVRDLAARGLLSWLPREARADDFLGAALVVAATGSVAGDTDVGLAASAENRALLTSTPPSEPLGRPSSPEPVQEPEPTEPPGRTARHGSVTLVGGGPGDPGLLTVAGLEALRTADVVICDRLAPLAALEQARTRAEIIDVGKIPRGVFTPQERINELLVEHALRGRRVVRFKGGDSFVFGRGGEEWQACAAAGIPVEVIPGVTSAVAAPALAGIPVTHRNLTQGFTVVSGHLAPHDPGSTLDWGALARANTTLIVMMGVATLTAITEELLACGLPATTPAATVADAGLPSQRTVRGTVATIAAQTHSEQIHPPAITVIGAVAGFRADA